MSDPQGPAEGYVRLYLDVRADSLDALAQSACDTYGYQAQVIDPSPEGRRTRTMIPNPQSKLAFLRQHVVGHLTQIHADWLKQQALANVQVDSVPTDLFS